MDIDTLIFDFNGTILDDVELCRSILNEMLHERGYETVSLKKYKEIFCFPVVEYYKKAGFDLDKYEFKNLAIEFIDKYQKASLKCKLCTHVFEVLNHYKNHKKLILLSASEIHNLIEQTDHFGLTPYFDAILGLDNIHAVSKIEMAKKYFQEHPIDLDKTLMIGDTDHDYLVANSLNIKCYLISNGHQSYKKLKQVTTNVLEDIWDITNIIK